MYKPAFYTPPAGTRRTLASRAFIPRRRQAANIGQQVPAVILCNYTKMYTMDCQYTSDCLWLFTRYPTITLVKTI
jgi:hypothetical protein